MKLREDLENINGVRNCVSLSPMAGSKGAPQGEGGMAVEGQAG